MRINKHLEIDKVKDLLISNDWTQQIRGLSKAITLIENDPTLSENFLSYLEQKAIKKKDLNQNHIIGITGLPGAGKSTLTNLLIKELRAQNKSVCILAVDPSSNLSGGAILGDRIRMQDHFRDNRVFIRSMGARGTLGGVAQATQTAIKFAQLIQFDIILIETVGVGQSESEIINIANTTILVLMPNSGDEIQLMKSGIIQLAHIYVINKCDLSDTTWMEQELRENVSAKNPQDWNPPVLKTSALKYEGIPELVQTIFAHERFCAEHPQPFLDKEKITTAFKIKGINHLGIVPKDKDQAQHFFSKILGLTQEGHEIVEDQKVSIDFVRCQNVRLEFLVPTTKESPITKFLETKGSGIQHIAFEVDDIDACVAYLNQQKIELIDKIPKSGAHHTRIVFIHPRATGGILVELVEEKKSGAV